MILIHLAILAYVSVGIYWFVSGCWFHIHRITNVKTFGGKASYTITLLLAGLLVGVLWPYWIFYVNNKERSK